MSEAVSIISGTLIAAEKVKSANVYNQAGEKLGTADDVMIDKISGRAI
jgi:sporulation protein YlmC with PRC-barrel domain